MKHAGGSPICARVTALAKCNPSGDIEVINGAVKDITEHKKNARVLQLPRQELIEIIDVIPDSPLSISKIR
jgi:hypothetical protein